MTFISNLPTVCVRGLALRAVALGGRRLCLGAGRETARSQKMLKNREESYLSTAPSNDGGQSFFTRELMSFRQVVQKGGFSEKGTFLAVS